MFTLMGNTNNSPDPFVQRIFKPLRGDTWTFDYAGLIVIIGTYYCLKNLNQIKENSLTKTTFRRIVMALILLSASSNMWGYGIQLYKGFSHNLNSIYLDREQTSVRFQGNEELFKINGSIRMVNCSNEKQTFYIKIKTPSFIKDLIDEEYIVLKDEITVYPKSIEIVNFNEEIEIINEGQEQSSYSTSAFEYILFNDDDETVFKGTSNNYYFD